MTESKLITEVRTVRWMDKDGVRHQRTRTFKSATIQWHTNEEGSSVLKSKNEIHWELMSEANQWQNRIQNKHKHIRKLPDGDLLWRK